MKYYYYFMIATFCYCLGFVCGYYDNQKEPECLTCASCEFKIELIQTQREALEQAEIIMSNNNIIDIDGSDDMLKCMELYSKVDSLYNLEY